MKAVSLKDALQDFFRSQGFERKISEAEVLEYWPNAVGGTIAAKTEALKMKEGILTIKVEDAVWRNELVYLRMDFREKINNKIGRELIKDIKFV